MKKTIHLEGGPYNGRIIRDRETSRISMAVASKWNGNRPAIGARCGAAIYEPGPDRNEAFWLANHWHGRVAEITEARNTHSSFTRKSFYTATMSHPHNPFAWLPKPGQVMSLPGGGYIYCKEITKTKDRHHATGEIVFTFSVPVEQFSQYELVEPASLEIPSS